MCGRFTVIRDLLDIMQRFNIPDSFSVDEYEPRYNIAPSQNVLAIVHDGVQNRMGHLRWGLIPFWAKDKKIGYKLINARAETLSEKGSFKHAYKKRRCIIPADGFYEWKKEGNQKQPYRITLKGDELFGFAGLWERWKADDGQDIHSCTIITTEPNELMQDIHQRMPVILRKEDESTWLDRSIQDLGLLDDLLKPFPSDHMSAYPVSSEVNSPRNEGEKLIDPLPSDRQD